MQDLKLKGLVIRAVPYKESDMIVTLVGVEQGVVTATARGCLKPSAKLRFAAQPFNFGDYVLTQGKNGHWTITECSQIDSFLPIVSDLEKYYAGFFILEALGKLGKEPQPELMLVALKSLERLAYGDDDPDMIVTDFIMSALSIFGNALDFRHCNICKCNLEDEAYFSEADGIVCTHCRSENCVPVDAISRSYIAKESAATHQLRFKANLLLLNLANEMLGVRISAQYFTEQI